MLEPKVRLNLITGTCLQEAGSGQVMTSSGIFSHNRDSVKGFPQPLTFVIENLFGPHTSRNMFGVRYSVNAWRLPYYIIIAFYWCMYNLLVCNTDFLPCKLMIWEYAIEL